MFEILTFVFGSFWRWLGTLMLISAFGSAIGAALLAFRRNK